MRALRAILIGIAVLAGLCVIIGLFLPDSRHVERSITMQATPADLQPFLDGYARFNEWSPWHDLDPDARYEFSGPERGVGARMSWHSDDPGVGSGGQEIVAVAPGRVEVALSFDDEGTSQARSSFDWAETAGGLRLTWGFDMEFGHNLLYRWFGLMMDGAIGSDYEKGLARLKPLVEQAAREREAAAAQAGAVPEAA